MNLLDIILLVPVVWFGIKGFSRGFILELASLIALFAGIWAAFHLSGYTQEFLHDYFKVDGNYLPAISFVVTFIVVALVIVLVGKLIDKLADLVALGLINKFFGALFGILKAALLIALVLFVIAAFDTGEKLIKPETKEDSLLYKPLSRVIPALIPLVREFQPKEKTEENEREPFV